jgi:hypothetical protein
MKLYAFDEVSDQLELLPIAARRALDHAGIKVSRAAWAELPLSAREDVVRCGEGAEVPVDAVRAALAPIAGTLVAIAPSVDPPSEAPPAELAGIYGRPIDQAVWARLAPLDRYALVKAGLSSRPERLSAAYDEILGARS